MRDDKLFACDARKCLDRLDLGVDNEKIVLPQEGALVFWGSRVNVGRWGKNSFLLAHNTNRWHFIHCFQCKVQLTLQCSHCAQTWEWTVGARYRARKECRVWTWEDIEGSAIEPQVLRSLPPNPHLPRSNVASRTFIHNPVPAINTFWAKHRRHHCVCKTMLISQLPNHNNKHAILQDAVLFSPTQKVRGWND